MGDQSMTRSQPFLTVALLGLLIWGAAGCRDSSESSITPKHPVPLPAASSFTTKPGKGAMVGGLPQGAAATSSMNAQAGSANTVGSKSR